MSTSVAPRATASAASAALTSLSWAPDGKPTTVQTARPPATVTGSRDGETQIENAPSSAASAASAATWPSVASGLSRVWSTVRASVSRVQVMRHASAGWPGPSRASTAAASASIAPAAGRPARGRP